MLKKLIALVSSMLAIGSTIALVAPASTASAANESTVCAAKSNFYVNKWSQYNKGYTASYLNDLTTGHILADGIETYTITFEPIKSTGVAVTGLTVANIKATVANIGNGSVSAFAYDSVGKVYRATFTSTISGTKTVSLKMTGASTVTTCKNAATSGYYDIPVATTTDDIFGGTKKATADFTAITPAVSISGDASVGSVLTATTTYDSTLCSFGECPLGAGKQRAWPASYQWKWSVSSAQLGIDSTYTIPVEAAGSTITARATVNVDGVSREISSSVSVAGLPTSNDKVEPAQSKMGILSTSAYADGVSTKSIAVMLKDASGNYINNASTSNLEISADSASVKFGSWVSTGSNGTYTINATSLVAGSYNITVKWNGKNAGAIPAAANGTNVATFSSWGTYDPIIPTFNPATSCGVEPVVSVPASSPSITMSSYRSGDTIFVNEKLAAGFTPGTGWTVDYDGWSVSNPYIASKTYTFYGAAEACPLPTAVISGTAQVGQTVSAVVSNPGFGMTVKSYQWYKNGSKISGATKSYYIAPLKYVNTDLTVAVVVYVDSSNTTTQVLTSSAVKIAPAPIVNKKAPVITFRKSGKLVKATTSTGAWTPAPKYAYQWYVDGVAVDGAIKSTYYYSSADRGHNLTVMVTASKTNYVSTSAMSASKVIPN